MDRLINSTSFSTADFDSKYKFDAWRAYMRSVAEVKPIDAIPLAKDYVVNTWELGNVVFCRETTPGATIEWTQRNVRNSPNDHYYIYLPINGSGYYRSEGKKFNNSEMVSRLGVVSLHSLVDPCQGRVENMDNIIIYIPRDEFCRMSNTVDLNINTFFTGHLGDILKEYIYLIYKNICSLNNHEAYWAGKSIVNIISSCLSVKNGMYSSDIVELSQKSKIRNFISEQMNNKDLSVDSITNSIGVSRATLYRMFEPEGGVMKYVERIRIQRVAEELCGVPNGRSIKQIAAESGLGDVSDLSRVYKRYFGCTPIGSRKSYSRTDSVGSAFGLERALRKPFLTMPTGS